MTVKAPSRTPYNPLGLIFITHWVMQTVAETPIFSRQTDKLFSEEEKRELIDFLAENPQTGDEIPGTGGVRKVRFSASGRGKRGGARVIYYYLDETMPLYALLAYAKNAKDDITPDEKRAVSALVVALKATRKELR
jgi:mRNA-degrading endonuclease RelE of RelBE toxin-antitoxin system